MKYFKCLSIDYASFIEGVIYPKYFNSAAGHSVDFYVKISPELWQQVPKREYYVQEGKIPEKWSLKTSNLEEEETFCDWLNKNSTNGSDGYTASNSGSYLYPDKNGVHYTNINHHEDYKEITFEQFKNYILEDEEMETKKEIIGYKCPQDLFGGDIKKGDLYVRHKDCYWYYPYKNGGPDHGQHIPKEIVETWEPVHKEPTPEIVINGRKAEFKELGLDFNGGCAQIAKDLFIDLYELIKRLYPGNKTVTSVTIGKGNFTVEQINQIAKYYINYKN